MFKDYAIKYFKVMQDMYNEQKNNLDFKFKGEYAVLGYIYNYPNITPKEISEFFNISSARVANILNRLESKNLINRLINQSDRRQIIINLTDEGSIKSKEIFDKHLEVATKIFENLGEEDTKKGLEILIKLKKILNKLHLEGELNVTT